MLGRNVALVAAGALVSLAALGAPAAETVVWRIGRKDGLYAEFACAGRYPDYAGRFREDPVFTPGTDDPAESWPFIHPGPADAWAGGRSHTFAIRFGAPAPAKAFYELRIHLVSTQGAIPPALEVDMNGTVTRIETERGPGDAALTDPAAGTPRTYCVLAAGDALAKERNEIRIATAKGSWVLYDAIELVGLDGLPPVTVVRASVLPNWYRHPKGAARRVRLDLTGYLTAPARVETTFGGKRFVEDVRPAKPLVRIDVDLPVENPEAPTPARIALDAGAGTIAAEAEIAPLRKWEVHLIHQTHLDIGYTHTQEDVLRLQVDHLRKALDYIERSKDYPEEARFKWHPEGMWAVEEFMRTASEEEKARLVDAARKGLVHIDSMYAQALTGMYSDEELFELMGSAVRFGRRWGVPVTSAMQSDVPGYTWGLVPALAHSGVRYIAAAPNPGDHIGDVFRWADKPFYWRSPSGKQKVLFWLVGKSYAWFHGAPVGHRVEPEKIAGYLAELERAGYPYDMVLARYNIGGDNGPPNPALPDVAKEWNERYAYPKLVVGTNSGFFAEFERRYADRIPELSGDYTPYWEDGCASTAADVATNRRACERLVRAQALWAVLSPGAALHDRFDAAWEKAIMYDEHTWGAWCSVSRPDDPFSVRQAEYKRRFALDAGALAAELEAAALGGRAKEGSSTVDVYNMASWPRTELVRLAREASAAGDRVLDDRGRPVPSQRLASGELAFVAADVPAFGARRYTVGAGGALLKGGARAEGARLSNGVVSLEVDPASGAIRSLTCEGVKHDFVDAEAGTGLNGYLYYIGFDAGRGPEPGAGAARVKVEDAGPLVATLAVESKVPGARGLSRRITVVSGSGAVEIVNAVDKLKERRKESVHFAFPFNVPGATVRLDVPWAVVRPEADQLPGANRNFYCVQRWVDVSNADCGVTLATVDAPLVQLHPVIHFDRHPNEYRRKIEPSPRIYSWVMNNHWHTNYAADQEGLVTFGYALEVHAGGYDAARAQRFGRAVHQPLLAVPADPAKPVVEPGLRIEGEGEGEGVVATSVSPSRDGEALIVRLFNTAESPRKARVLWSRGRCRVWLSNPMEDRLSRLTRPLEMAPLEIVTLRVEPPARGR